MKVAKSLFLCLGILLCASCAQQDEELGTSLNRSPLEKVTVTAGPILPPPSTRVATEREGQVMHFNWEKDDAILLANTKQQLPYLATQAGASTQFLSALTGSNNVADYINGVVDKGEIYAYYPYNAGERIDMETKSVAISQDEPFLYAVDTIQNEAINLHFYHAFAYLKLNISAVGAEMQDKLRLAIAPDYRPMTLVGSRFNFATNQVEYTDYKDEMELTAEQLADTEHLYPILPAPGEGYFRFSCQLGDEFEQEAYTYKVPIPEGGLQAGHVYEITLQFNTLWKQLEKFYNETNGNQWKNNTNWLSHKPVSEWYGIKTDDDGNIIGIDLHDNNLVGDYVAFEFPSTLTSFNIDNNAINSLRLLGNDTISVRLDNCVKYGLNVERFNTVEVTNCDFIEQIELVECKKSFIRNCGSKGQNLGLLTFGASLDEAVIENSVLSYISIWAYNLTIENSTLKRPLDTSAWDSYIASQLNISNSTIQGLNHNCFSVDAQINLNNTTLIYPEFISGLVLSNLTVSFTGAEWQALLESYHSDINLLQNIYNLTDGVNWTNSTNWLTETPWNEWYGIETDSEGHIKSIELPNNNLTGQLYIGLDENSCLTHLNLDKNNFSRLEIGNWGSRNFTSYSLNESNMDELIISSVDSVYISACTIPSITIGYHSSEQTDNGICSFSNCTVSKLFNVECKNLEISGGSYEYFSVNVSKQLTIKNATIGFEVWSNFGVNSDTDVILENATIKYLDLNGTHEPVTLTKTFKGSEWQAIFNEAFGIQ